MKIKKVVIKFQELCQFEVFINSVIKKFTFDLYPFDIKKSDI